MEGEHTPSLNKMFRALYQILGKHKPNMPANLPELPEELITQICSYDRHIIRTLRETNRALSRKASNAFADQYLRTVHLAPTDMNFSSLGLSELAVSKVFGQALASHVQEIVLHPFAITILGDLSFADHDSKIAGQLLNMYMVLLEALPNLPNCRKVTLSREMPLKEHEPGRYELNLLAFYGMRADLGRRNVPILCSYDELSHDMICLMRQYILKAVAKTENNVEDIDLEVWMPIQDVRHRILRDLPCNFLTAPKVKSLRMGMVDCMDHIFIQEFIDTYLNPHMHTTLARNRGLQAAFPPPPAQGQPEHHCQDVGQSRLNSWERESTTRASVQSFLRHYPNLVKLQIASKLFITEGVEVPLWDAIPSYLPPNLKELAFSGWIGNGSDLARHLRRLDNLRKLTLSQVIFHEIKVFKRIMQMVLEHPALTSLQLVQPHSAEDGPSSVRLCLNDCTGVWCRRTEVETEPLIWATPALDFSSTVARWQRHVHAKPDTLTIDFEDIAGFMHTMFYVDL